MSKAGKVLKNLLDRSRRAQKESDCESAYAALLQAMRQYGYAMGAQLLDPDEGYLKDELEARANKVFDGCVGR
jgi:type II secretory pathway pseudopilin PulG